MGLDEIVAYAEGVLVGERVRLRPLLDADLPILDAWWQNLGTMPLQRDAVLPQPSGSASSLLRGWSLNDSDSSVGFSVVARDSDELVGHVTLFGATLRSRCATLAIMIGADHMGRGFGTDAVRVLLRYGFDELNLHRIELRTMDFNDRALATYRRVGFVEEGRRREATFHAGRYHDEVLMAVLEHEYRRS